MPIKYMHGKVCRMYSYMCSNYMCGDSGDIQDEFVAGEVKCVEFMLNYHTLDDHTFNSFLTVNLTSNLLQGPESIASKPPVSKPAKSGLCVPSCSVTPKTEWL